WPAACPSRSCPGLTAAKRRVDRRRRPRHDHHMDLTAQLLADAVAIVALLGLVWRASSTLTRIRFEVVALRKDVDRIVTDKDAAHRGITERLSRDEERLLEHERWHRGQRGR